MCLVFCCLTRKDMDKCLFQFCSPLFSYSYLICLKSLRVMPSLLNHLQFVNHETKQYHAPATAVHILPLNPNIILKDTDNIFKRVLIFFSVEVSLGGWLSRVLFWLDREEMRSPAQMMTAAPPLLPLLLLLMSMAGKNPNTTTSLNRHTSRFTDQQDTNSSQKPLRPHALFNAHRFLFHKLKKLREKKQQHFHRQIKCNQQCFKGVVQYASLFSLEITAFKRDRREILGLECAVLTGRSFHFNILFSAEAHAVECGLIWNRVFFFLFYKTEFRWHK